MNLIIELIEPVFKIPSNIDISFFVAVAGDFQGMKITSNGEKAAEMFCKVETLMPHIMPFTWLFIRPPWATTGACCKECVFNNMKAYIAKKVNNDRSLGMIIWQCPIYQLPSV